jgi:hypothetical protein
LSRKVEVQIVGNSSSLHKALGSATGGTSKLGSAFESAARFAAGFGIAIGGFELLKFGKEAISSAAQTQKATESIRENFGKAGESVIKFNEHAAASFGIAIGPASQFATQIGLMTTNIGLSKTAGAQMTIGLEKLAGAVGMIKGQDPAASFAKLNKALLGNTRGLKDMGIAITPVDEKLQAMKDGFIGPKGTISTLTAAQRAQVIYGLAVRKLPTLLDQAKQHSGDFANQLLILKARLSNLSEEIGAKALPVIQNLVGDISKIAAAPNFTVGVEIAFHGIEKGAKSIAEGIQHALTGSTKTVQIKAPSGLILGSKQETSKGIIQNIADGLKGANWSQIGQQVGAGISKSIKFTGDALKGLVSGLTSAVDANKGAIAAVGIGLVITMFSDIVDPTFWIHHWELALAVAGAALSVSTDGIGGVAEKVLPRIILKPLQALGGRLRQVGGFLMRELGDAIKREFPAVGKAAEGIGLRIISPLRGLPGRAADFARSMMRQVIGEIVHDLGAVGSAARAIVTRIVQPLAGLAGRVLGPIAKMGRAFSQGMKLGRSVMEGIASGLSGLIGWLEGKIGDIASGLLSKAKGILHITSPSKVFADEVGRPIVEGIALGITKHAGSVSDALAGAVTPGGVGATGRGHGGGGRGRPIEVTLMLDRHVLARVLADTDKDYRRQNSGRPLLSGR